MPSLSLLNINALEAKFENLNLLVSYSFYDIINLDNIHGISKFLHNY